MSDDLADSEQAVQESFSPPSLWRDQAGFFRPGLSDQDSIHTLLGHFLFDRHTPSLLKQEPESDELEHLSHGWGEARPFEKVIHTASDLQALIQKPDLYRNAITIIEPWQHVGHNPIGEGVRASFNIAFLAQKIADCDTILFPLWSSGLLDKNLTEHVLTSSLAVIIEGGAPSVRDHQSFKGSCCSPDELLDLVESLLLSRSLRKAPAIFICLGHQLAAQAHIRLIQRATKAVLEEAADILGDQNPLSLAALESACKEIIATGEELVVVKHGQVEVAAGWNHPEFAVALNEVPEVGHCEIVHYNHSGIHPSPHFPKLLLAHAITADEYDGVVESSISYEKDLNILMFHSDEVNEEAILFANWAYRLIHDALVPSRRELVVSPLAWLLKLPDSIEILGSTTAQGTVSTEVSATCVSYKDFETGAVKRSFSCQFHPELLDD